MFSIERQPYGFKMVLGGTVYRPEMAEWGKEVEAVLADQAGPFCVFFDIRTLFPPNPSTQQAIAEGLINIKKAGLQRSVAAFEEKPTHVVWERLANWAAIAPAQRYINANEKPDWEALGLNWLTDGVDPNK